MAYDIGLKVGIDGETEFRKSIQNINDEYKTLKTEMTSITSAFDRNDKSQENLTKQNEVLTKQIELQRKKLQETTRVLEKTTEEYGKTDKKTLSWQRTVNSTTAELNKLESQLETNNKTIALQNSGWNTLGRTLDTTGAKVTALGDGMVGAGQKMTVGITAPIIALGTASVAAFKNVDDGMDTIIKKTGATGESAEELEEIYKNLGSNAPEDLGDVGAAIGEINTRLEFTGEKLEKASTDFLKFAKVNDTDVNSAIQLVTRSMADAGIEVDEYNSVLDMLTVAAQKSGISMDSLATNLTKYGAPMRALGLDTKTSIAIFAGWEKAGVNTEIAFAGMKKAISNWAAEGKDSRVEFQNTLDAIKSAPDIAAATTMAIDVFGQKAGPDLADAIQGGRFEIDDYIEALDNAGGAVENTYEQIESSTDDAKAAFNKIEIASSELGETVLEVLTPALEETGEIIGDVADWYSDLNPEMQEAIIVTAGLAAAAGPLLVVSGSLLRAGGTMLTTIGTVSGAIGVMTTGATAATPAIGGMAAAMTALTGPVGLAILGVTAMTVGLGALYVHQKNNTVQTKEQIEMNKKFITSTDNVTDSIGKNMEARETSLKTTENEVVAAKTLADKIFDLADKQNKSAAEMAALDSFISEFNQIMPDANLLIDEHTGVLNLSRDAVTNLIAVEEDRIRIAAVSDLLIQNAKDQLDVTRQLSDAESERNRLQTLENEAVQNAIDQGGTIIQIKERLNKVYDEYGDAITAANESTDTLRGKQTELNTEQDKLNQLVSDPTAWDAYTTNVGTATASTEAYATDANAALERYKQESAVKSEETGYGIGSSTAKGLNDSASTAGDAAQVVHDNVASKLNPLGAFGEKTGGEVNAGLRVGMEDKEAVDKSVGGLVGWVMDAFNIGFDIHSPAKKMYPIGVNVLKGIFSGMNSLDIGAFADSMVQKLLDAFNNGKVTALGIFNSMGEMGSALLEKMGISLGITGGGLPVNGAITSEFGYRPPEETDGKGSTWHAGTDIGAPEGTPIYAVEGGIANLSTGSGYGNLVIIDTGAGIQEYYGHMSGFNVEDGQMVNKGDIIGFVGSTGNSTGPHLHFGVLQNGEWIDPLSLYGFSVGSRYIPYDMPIMVHQGEMIVPRSENPYANSGGQVLPEASSSGSKQPVIIQVMLDKKVLSETMLDSLDSIIGQKVNKKARGMA